MKIKTLQQKGLGNQILIFFVVLIVIGASFYLAFSDKFKEEQKIIKFNFQSSNKKVERKPKIEHESPLGKAIEAALEDIGISVTEISISRTERMDHNSPRIVTRRHVEVPSIYPLAYCNLIITRFVQKESGKVFVATEDIVSNNIRRVTMQIGEDELVTQQVILTESPASREKFMMPVFENGGKIAFVIDDFGYSYNQTAQAFLRINRPLTISILPGLAASKTIAEDASAWGHEVLLHLPMEADNPHAEIGVSGIFLNSTKEEIHDRIHTPLSKMPQIIGVNNHMGSKVTQNRTIMTAVIGEVKKKGIFYIDSMTSPESVGWQVAREMGVPTAKSRGFIDNEVNVKAIKKQIMKIAAIASKEGHAIAIGHTHQSTLKAIQEMIPVLEKQGFTFVYASELLME